MSTRNLCITLYRSWVYVDTNVDVIKMRSLDVPQAHTPGVLKRGEREGRRKREKKTHTHTLREGHVKVEEATGPMLL